MSRGRFGARLTALALTGVAALATAGAASASVTPRAARVAPAARVRTYPLIPFGRIGNDVVASSNWSGYAVQDASPFTDVTGSWVQPAATCNAYLPRYAAFWAGIDGYSSASVEQLGTDSDCTGYGRPSYYAWYEMYPADSVELSTTRYPVKPGDTLSAQVSVTGTTFVLSIKSSEGWTFSTTQTGSGLARSSAELIAESPEICGLFICRTAALSDFGDVSFTNATAAVGGGAAEPLGDYTADSGPHEITAVTSAGVTRAQPSPLTAGGTAFSIAWEHD